MTQFVPADPARLLVSRVAVIVAAAMLGRTYRLTAPLIAFRLLVRGLDRAWIGVNIGMHAIGILFVLPALLRLAGRIGVRWLAALLLALLVLSLLQGRHRFGHGSPCACC